MGCGGLEVAKFVVVYLIFFDFLSFEGNFGCLGTLDPTASRNRRLIFAPRVGIKIPLI